MIPVLPAPEPPTFDDKVRQPGLDAVRELVGEPRSRPRRGPKRAKVYRRREDIPYDEFPDLWRAAQDDLLGADGRVCAYACLYIEPVTGAASVDHMLPKSKAWDKVYEWSNYRLACSLMNARKGNAPLALDPFEVKAGWFELEFTGHQVVAGAGVEGRWRERVDATIELLGLNDSECRGAREQYVEDYLDGHIRLAYLERGAPFVARELRRQGRLRREDS